VTPRDIRQEMEESYLDYAMSVIVQRALPDVRDGLKPVQRRILYAMREMGLTHGAKPRKAAAVVGDVLGKYHPHGDTAVYDALVRMAQPFSLRYPLIEGQGNFGSVDGDSAAAMRYTEARLTPIAEVLLSDIEKDTVAFVPTYDATRKEPQVVPAALPNLLLNGSVGIAVGMATAIPPHNLAEVADALILLAEQPETPLTEVLKIVRGPDFPTGGLLYGRADISQAYSQGAGPMVLRGRAEIVEHKRGRAIVISEIPYEIRKAALIEHIAELVRDKRLEGIRDIRDESDKEGLRIVIELRSDAAPQRVLNALYKRSDLERRYHLNLLALVDGIQPRVLSLKTVLEEVLKHRREVIRRRSAYDLARAQERAHILEGLTRALSKIDAVIRAIKLSRSREDAHRALKAKFRFSDIQASAILALPLSALARLEREKILGELGEQRAKIVALTEILKSAKKLTQVLVHELRDLRERFGDERRTTIVPQPVGEIADEDLVPEASAVIVLTSEGYAKRMPPAGFHVQRKGGQGVTGIGLSEEEHLEHFTVANTHDTILFFTTRGRVFRTPAYEIPEASRTSRGRAIVNFIALSASEQVAAIAALPKTKRGAGMIVLATRKGVVKRLDGATLANIRRNGLNAIALRGDDTLAWARVTSGEDDLLFVTRRGMALRFPERDIRLMGREAAGVRGIALRRDDTVTGVAAVFKHAEPPQLSAVIVTEGGFGKRVKLGQYRRQRRGGVGVRTLAVSPKTGAVVDVAIAAQDSEELIAASAKGKTLRVRLKEVRELSRSAQGTRIMRLLSGDRLASFSVL